MKQLVHKILAISIVILFLSSFASILPVYATTTTATLSVGPNPGGLGQPLTIFITVSPGPSSGVFQNSFWLGIRDPSGSWQVASYSSDTLGHLLLSFTPTQLGTYLFGFNYTGNTIGSDVYSPSSALSQSVTVYPTQTTTASLAVFLNPSTVNYPLTLNGQILPAPPAGSFYTHIYVNVTKPDGTINTIGPFVSDAEGQMSTTYTPTTGGGSMYHFKIYNRYEVFNSQFYAESYSSRVDVIIYSAPSVYIYPTPVIMNVGQSQGFQAMESDGTSPIYYQWYLDNNPVPGATSHSWTYSPSSEGSHTISVKVTDSLGANAMSSPESIIVNPEFVISISPPFAIMNIDQSKEFSASLSGGTPPFSYQWSLESGPVTGATSSTWTYSPSSTGSHQIHLTVWDNTGYPKNSGAPVLVNEILGASVSPGSLIMDETQSVLLTTTVSGGSPPYTYQWYSQGTLVSSGTSNTWTLSPSYSGNFQVYSFVTDSTGAHLETNHASITVNIYPSIAILSAPQWTEIGQPVLFTSTTSGGTTPYSYQWYLDDSPVLGATGSTWSYSPSLAGTHSVYVQLVDNASLNLLSNTVSIAVFPALSVTVTPISLTMFVGQIKTFTAVPVGGTGSYIWYNWYVNGALQSGYHLSTFDYYATSEGSPLITVTVEDSINFVSPQSSAPSVSVNGALGVSISPNSITLNVGQSKLFTATASGGSSLYQYQWYVNDAAQPTAQGMTYAFMPSLPGTYDVFVIVMDGFASATSSVASVTVNAVLSVSVSPTGPLTLTTGQIQAFSVSASGGSGILHYQWYLDNSAITGEVATSYEYTAAVSGFSHLVKCVVTDSATTPTSVISNIVQVTVNTVGLSVSISPNYVNTDVGQSQTFTAVPAGGSGSYVSYQWYVNGMSISVATSTFGITFGAAGVSPLVTVTVTDSLGATSPQSSAPSITVNALPSIVVAPSGPINTVVGQPAQVFTSTVYGGVGPFTYQWYLDGAPVSTSWSYSFAPSTAGTYHVYDVVTDIFGNTATSSTVTVTVNALSARVTIDSSPSISGWFTIDGNPTLYPYRHSFDWVPGSTHTIAAGSPEDHGSGIWYTWTSWSDSGSISHTIIVPSSPTTITANYKMQYQVSFVVNPSNAGTTNPSVPTLYDQGAVASINAIVSPGYTFTSWVSPAAITISNPAALATSATINGPGIITASFAPIQQVTLTLDITTPGIVTVNPSKATYGVGETITLTATPNHGYYFTAWGGDIAGSSAVTTLIIDANPHVTAKFDPMPAYAVAGQYAPPPPDLNYNIPPFTPLPVQATWPVDKDGDGIIDLVAEKPITILVNAAFPQGTLASTDQVKIVVTFEGKSYTNVSLGYQLTNNAILWFSPIVPHNIGAANNAIAGTYQINNGAIQSFPTQTVVMVRDTNALSLTYTQVYRTSKTGANVDYGKMTQTAFDNLNSKGTSFIAATYPSKSITSKVASSNIAGAAYSSKYPFQGMQTDAIAAMNKRVGGTGVGVAVVPGTNAIDYFTYHHQVVNGLLPAGVSFGPDCKGVISLEGYPTSPAHEVAHTYGLYWQKPPGEQYQISSPNGYQASGIWPTNAEWRSGYSFMGMAYKETTSYSWVDQESYKSLFKSMTQTLADPEVVTVSGIIYKDGTPVLFPAEWLHYDKGTPDQIVGGDYSLKFYAPDGTTVLLTTSFDASFSMTIDPAVYVGMPPINLDGFGRIDMNTAAFAFTTIYPANTYKIEIVQTSESGVPIPGGPRILATILASDIVDQDTAKASFSNPDYSPIDSFECVFTPSTGSSYKMSATNPGTFCYNLEITNNNPMKTYTVTMEIPYDFVFKKLSPDRSPVEIDGDPVSSTDYQFIPGTPDTPSAKGTPGLLIVSHFQIRQGQTVTLTVRLDYAQKFQYGRAQPYTSSSQTTFAKGYSFKATINSMKTAPLNVAAVGKKVTAIGGFLIDNKGFPKGGLTAKALNTNGVVVNTIDATSDGFYFLTLPAAGTYTVKVYNSEGGQVAISNGLKVAKDQFIQKDFDNLNPADPAITGFVKENSGNGASGMQVQLLNKQGKLVATTETNLGGYYVFRFSQPGTYTIQIILPISYGAIKTQETVSVKQFETTTANFSVTLNQT